MWVKASEASTGRRSLGTYECELRPVFDSLFQLPFLKVVDVGAAEGYYAVGAALKWPKAEIVAFECEAMGRDLLRRMAQLNAVSDRVQVEGECTSDALSNALRGRDCIPTLCIMDVEGAEMELCHPGNIPELARSYIIVETHEFQQPGVTRRLQSRFASTHLINEILPRSRTLTDFRYSVPFSVRVLLGKSLLYIVDEWRHLNCSWLFMQPRKCAGFEAGILKEEIVVE